MAPTLQQEIGLRQEPGLHQDIDITPPVVQPEGLPSPLSSALPGPAAGMHRLAARTARPHGRRLDWAELGIVGLMVGSAAVSVARLFWAIH